MIRISGRPMAGRSGPFAPFAEGIEKGAGPAAGKPNAEGCGYGEAGGAGFVTGAGAWPAAASVFDGANGLGVPPTRGAGATGGTPAGYRTGAIYLWGYSAEMTLKAAYFALLGRAETALLTWSGDILPAIDAGRGLGIAWPKKGEGHNVRAWAELLVLARAATPGAAYLPPFDQEVQMCGQDIGELWSETLRYHKNVAYLYEMRQVREAAEWLLLNADLL